MDPLHLRQNSMIQMVHQSLMTPILMPALKVFDNKDQQSGASKKEQQLFYSVLFSCEFPPFAL
jgi:hypothetical protein